MEFIVWTLLGFLALYPLSMGALHYASHRVPGLPVIGVHVSHHHAVHASNYAPEQRIRYAPWPWFAEQALTPAAAFGLCKLATGALFIVDSSLVNFPGFFAGFAAAHLMAVYLGDQYHRPRSWLERFAWYRRAAARHRVHHESDGRVNFEIVPWGEWFQLSAPRSRPAQS